VRLQQEVAAPAPPEQSLQQLERRARRKQHLRLREAFLVLGDLLGVPHYAAADAECQLRCHLVVVQRADGDIELRAAVGQHDADCARIDPAGGAL
jgi:hypothetical protein